MDKGFSLIELLVVVSIFAIMAALATPSYVQYSANNKASTYTSELMGYLRIGRATAISEQKNIIVCTIQSGTSCSSSASAWNKGWLVTSSDGSKIYKRTQFKTNGSAINTGITISPSSSISYSKDGFPTPGNFTITIKPPGCTRGFEIVSSPGGLIQKQSVDC